jgi:hypothetical protein
MRDILFVVGMGRSGTSALTRIVSLCGGVLPHRLLPPNFANPSGYWEPERAVQINDSFLASHGSSWYDGSLTLQSGLVGAGERHAFVSEIAAFLRGEFDAGGPMVLKDPRISALLPYWTAAARELRLRVKVVHVFRDPGEVYASLAQRDGLTADHAFALWLKYNVIAERDARAFPRVFVSYDDLMRDWEPLLSRCIERLGIDAVIDDAARSAVAAFLSPALRHHNGTAAQPDEILPLLANAVAETHDLLKAAAAGTAPAAAFDAVGDAYAATRSALEFRLTCSLRERPAAAA